MEFGETVNSLSNAGSSAGVQPMSVVAQEPRGELFMGKRGLMRVGGRICRVGRCKSAIGSVPPKQLQGNVENTLAYSTPFY